MKTKETLKSEIDQLDDRAAEALENWLNQWDRLEKSKPKDCFVIMPFSATREYRNEAYWTKFFDNFLSPALKKCGFRARRSDANGYNIVRGIMSDLVCSDVVIAVLTDSNANVWYELGVRHSQRRGTVMICQKGQDLPFDLSSYGTAFYDESLDFEAFSVILKPFLEKALVETEDSPICDFINPGLSHCINRSISGRRAALEIIDNGFSLGLEGRKIEELLARLDEQWKVRRHETQLTIIKNDKVVYGRNFPRSGNPKDGWKDYVLRNTDNSAQSLYPHMRERGHGLRLASIDGYPGRVTAICYAIHANYLIVVESHVSTGEL